MRTLLLLRGLPGSGKSTWMREAGLEAYALSADTIRTLYAGPVLEADGRWRIAGEYDRAVWQELLDLLEKRMQRGELVVVDATHSHPRSFQNYQQLVKKYRYRTYCVDFAAVPSAVCQERNQDREAYKVVPPLEMERMADNLRRSLIPKWVTPVAPAAAMSLLTVEPQDVSHYQAVHHIGDLQGCFTPLQAYFDNYGFQDDELYIFVGDYLDRGTENAAVMTWLLANYQRPNLVLIEGNHEAHLRNWTQHRPARSRQFNQVTAPELAAAEINSKKVHGFLYQLREVYYYNFHGTKVLVTHGGLSALPDKLALISSQQLIKGTGTYEDVDTSDAAFAATAPADTYQIHGHRNRFSSPLRVNERCCNLEGKIEFGGELRTVSLTRQGFEERAVPSTIDATATIIEPVGDLPAAGESENGSVSDLVTALRASRGVYEKAQAVPWSHISSFNFKRDVFYNKTWDELNVHARGLFINTAQALIVARSYEKFFNLGERPETQPDVLARTLQFPVRAWVKENGYLGLVGYDPERDELVFASKSSLSSDFAGWLRQQFDQLAPPNSPPRQAITDYLRDDGGRTLVFEVIEPVHDPHIITYAEPALILLDIVKNSAAFTVADAKERQKIADLLGCRLKRQAASFKNHDSLLGWLKLVQQFDYQYQDQPVEGFVLEDAGGFMVKVKLPWYAFWRQMRTQLTRAQAGKPTQLPALEINHDLAASFLTFLSTKTPADLAAADLITLRHEFETT